MSDNCISELAFNSLPQAVRDWIQELGWKREEIISFHVQHSSPKVVPITDVRHERYTACFSILKSGKWKKKA